MAKAASQWHEGDAENLPVDDHVADAYIISFGIRNCTDVPAVLREAKRVLKPGGRFFCLEFSRLAIGGLEPVYDFYSFNAIPALGKLLANDAEFLPISGRIHPPVSGSGNILGYDP